MNTYVLDFSFARVAAIFLMYMVIPRAFSIDYDATSRLLSSSDNTYQSDRAGNITRIIGPALPALSVSNVPSLLAVTQHTGVQVMVNANVAWQAACSEPWISFPNGTTGSGSSSLSFSVASNPNTTPRSAQVTLSESGGLSTSFVIHQEAAASLIGFGIAYFTIPELGSAQVTQTVTSNAEWELSSWPIWVAPQTLRGTGNGDLLFSVAENTSSVIRTGDVVLKQIRGPTTASFSVTQEGRTPVLTFHLLTPDQQPLSASSVDANGRDLQLTLSYHPLGADIILIKNDGTNPVSGRFNNLPDGSAITLLYGGVSYAYILSYYGGDGNDVVLLWRDTQILGWGRNQQSELGNGGSTFSQTPTRIDQFGAMNGRRVTQITGGSGFSIALCADGSVLATGTNEHGQIGDGTTQDKSSWVNITNSGVLSGRRVISISSGEFHTVALCSDNTLAAWGWNGFYQLGSASAPGLVPSAVSRTSALSGKTIVAVAAGNLHTLVLTSENQVYAWGYNGYGSLGDGTTSSSYEPVLVQNLSGENIIQISAGYHSAALSNNGRLFMWGHNFYGALGTGDTTQYIQPQNVSNYGALFGRTISSVQAGAFSTQVICTDGRVVGWGLNNDGQLGNGTTASTSTPTLQPISTALNGQILKKLRSGNYHSLGITSTGQFVSWGSNLTSPTFVLNGHLSSSDQVTDMFAGDAHSFALVAAVPLIPEIAIQDVTGSTPVELNSGNSTLSFGSLTTSNGTANTLTLHVWNRGRSSLSGISAQVIGASSSDFTITTSPATTIQPGTNTVIRISFRPLANGNRSALLRIVSNDPDENPFDISLSGSGLNSPPTISTPEAVTMAEDDVRTMSINVTDTQTTASTLNVQAESSNLRLFPEGRATFSGTDSSRTLTLRPADNESGSSQIHLRVMDEDGATAETSFMVTVTPVNDLPTITDLSNRTIDEDQPGGTGAVSFTIGDVETLPANLVVTATSSNTALVPNSGTNLVLGASSTTTRTLTVLPTANASGTSTITLNVADADGGQTSKSFLLTVNSVNDAPTITAISEQAILPNTTTGALPFTIMDVETAAASLSLGKDSSNQTLVPLNNIIFGGSGNNRTVTVTPASGQTGQSTITISVSDGVIITPTTFLLRVTNNNTNLSSLALSSGTLSPAFASGTTTYTATVPNAGSTITVTPTLADANATVRVNGNLVTSGTPSGAVSLSVGSNPAITVLVTAQDGTTKTYSVTPTRNPLPIATTLAATSFGSSTATLNGTVNPQGVSTTVTFRYGTTTAYGSTVNVTGSPFTGTSVTNVSAALTGLLPGTLYHYQILAANSTDSTTGADMTFTTLSDNARLTSLALNAGSITFQPDTLIYSTTVPNSSSSLTITPSVQQVNATLRINNVPAPSGSGTAVPLNVGDNTLSIAVTAQDGTTTRTYTLNVRRRSADASLASLNLSGITLNPAFSAGTTNYTATVPFLTTSTNLAATTTHNSAVVTSGTGLRNLVVGANALNVLVTAEDGNTLTYTVTVTRDPASTNASLAGLTLSSGTLTPAFASGILSYSATVAANVTSVTVTPTVQQANATLTIQGTTISSGVGRVVSLVTGDNTIPIVVTAQDGTTIRSYSLTVRRRSAVADLASLSLSGVSLSPAFSSTITSYTATVPNATASTTITAAATHASASLAGDGLRSLNTGSNSLTVTVTAEDGNTKNYTVTVQRNPLPVAVTGGTTAVTATNATLTANINAGGVSTATSFEYGTTTTYGQTVVGSPGSVSGTNSASITAAITNLMPGTMYHFRAKAANSTDSAVGEDMTFTTLRNNANLASLVVSAGTVVFNANTTTYALTVLNSVNAITVTPTAADGTATVRVNGTVVISGAASGPINLEEGINPAVNVLVTAEDGTTKTYALNYTRARLPTVTHMASTNITKKSAKLSARVDGQGETSNVTFEYSTDADFSTFASLTPAPATVSGATNTLLQADLTGLARETIYFWRVRAVSAAGERLQAGESWETLDSDAYLMALETRSFSWYSAPSINPTFQRTRLTYSMPLPYYVPEVTFAVNLPSLSSEVSLNGQRHPASGFNTSMIVDKKYIPSGSSVLSLMVRDVELDISRTYTFTVHRAADAPWIDYGDQPYSSVVFAGDTHLFAPPISGLTPMTYQWRKNDVNLVGETSATYRIPLLTANHAGRYSLRIDNALGAQISRHAYIAVITRQPPELVTLADKGTLSLSVAVAAPKGRSISYQWHNSNEGFLENRGRISGAKSSTLKIRGFTLADESRFSCEVSLKNGATEEAFNYTIDTKVLLAELPIINEVPLPDASVSVLYSEAFPVDGTERKTPSSYAATGLPPGLKCDSKTGVISGRPTAARKNKLGAFIPYDVTLTAKNAKGTATRKTTLYVEPLPEFAVGVFAAPLERHDNLNEGLGGRYDMTILPTGSFSGKVTLGTHSWPFSGVLVGGGEITAKFSIQRKKTQSPLEASFRIIPGSRSLREGLISLGGEDLWFEGWRRAASSSAVAPYSGYHTFGILPLAYSSESPQAAGYGSFTVGNTGSLKLSGRTADGESLTVSSFISDSGEVVLFQNLYKTLLRGSLQGSMSIDHVGATNDENTIDGRITWSRPESTSRIFPLGFGSTDYRVVGGGYVAPNAKLGQNVMELPLVAGNALISFQFNSEQVPAYAPDIGITIRPDGSVVRPSSNPAKTSLTITPKSGRFSGGFTLIDSNPLPSPAIPRSVNRAIKFQGQIFRYAGGWSGAGYFLMPELPSAGRPSASKTLIIPGMVSLEGN